ncbi:hypothetical protein SAMN04489724_2046 [Algoriphagus locisalis]|uniref:Uncharacterized protein n=1 Tax=Algoriphagus locisalis TaxID=305507 RepID=A0A1I7AL26_9BACT|nr:hypothetical protein [Algoriphagus locisalis]SFT75616.1 hypothetical protein SAMN04489724_2046 [Algoriphagus locisalis]
MSKKILGLLIFLVSAQTGFSQDTRPYKGGYTFKGLRGTAELTYTLDEEMEPILNGPFTFNYNKMDSLQNGLFVKLQVKGTYEEDLKDVAWSYNQETHQISIQDILNREIQASLASRHVELEANYENGSLEGQWDYLEKNWQNNEYLNLFEAQDLTFRKDSLQGSVKLISSNPEKQYQIFGQVNKEGLMEGNWDFFYPLDSAVTIHETRRYEKGFLIGLSKMNNLSNEKLDEVVFYNAIVKLDSLNQGFEVDYRVSSQAFGLIFNDGYTENSDEFREQYLGTSLLQDALSRILQFEEDFFSEDGSLVKYPLATRRFVYAVSEEDQIRYDEIIDYFDRLKAQSSQKALLDFLSLNQNTSDSLAFTAAYVDYLNDKIQSYEQVIGLLRNGEIKYFDTENYVQDGLNFLHPTEEITYTYNTDLHEKTLEFPELSEQRNLGIDLLAHIETEWEFFEQTLGFIQQQQINFRQTNELDVLEERILSERKLVNEIKDSINVTSERHQILLDSVHKHLSIDNYQSLLDVYNNTEGFLEKAAIGDELIELFLFQQEKLPELGRYENLGSFLRKEFTAKTLDPFTFETDFEYLKQQDLIQAAEEIIDYELDLITKSKDFREIQAHLINLDALESRLLELEGKNTKRLERNIRKVSGNINQLKKLLSI